MLFIRFLEGCMAYKGRFKPVNIDKYKGDASNIIYRSLWEAKLFNYMDKHPYVIEWASEEFFIPYISPVDKKMHRYFPDVYVVLKNPKDETLKTLIIEVKPYKQVIPPDPSKKNATKTGRTSTRYLREVKTYAVNDAKWKAAREYCADRGWQFEIFTEKELGIK